jgi:hypothetical protein
MNDSSNNNSNNIILTVGGDFCPAGKIETDYLNGRISKSDLFDDIKPIFFQSDLSIINLEIPLTLSNERILKNGTCLKAHPEMVCMLNYLGIHLVCLANNHVRDYGNTGVKDTLFQCGKYGIDTVGAGNTLKEACQIYYRNIKGRLLAIINVAENELANATPKRAGANPYDLIALLTDINEAKQKASHIIIVMHGGLEYTHYPSPESIRLFRFLAEQGVTAIIRHHPHYVQGFEVWKGVPIFYSLGNLLFDTNDNSKPGWFEGMLVTVIISPDNTCQFEVHPFEQCRNKLWVQLLKGEKKQSFLAKLEKYSITIQKPLELKSEWDKVIEEKKSMFYGLLVFSNFFLLRLIRKFRLLKYFRPSFEHKLRWESYVRCEAHREVFLDILEQK